MVWAFPLWLTRTSRAHGCRSPRVVRLLSRCHPPFFVRSRNFFHARPAAGPTSRLRVTRSELRQNRRGRRTIPRLPARVVGVDHDKEAAFFGAGAGNWYSGLSRLAAAGLIHRLGCSCHSSNWAGSLRSACLRTTQRKRSFCHRGHDKPEGGIAQ